MSGGVPLGSALGLLMFVTNVNDLPNETESYLNMLADNAKIMKGLGCDSNYKILQRNLHKLQQWSDG